MSYESSFFHGWIHKYNHNSCINIPTIKPRWGVCSPFAAISTNSGPNTPNALEWPCPVQSYQPEALDFNVPIVVLCSSPLSKSVRFFLNFWRLWLLDAYYMYYVLNPQNTQKHTRNSHCFWTRHYNQSSWSKPATKSTPYLDSLGTNFWHQGNCSTIRFLLNIEHGRSGQLMSLSYLSKPKLHMYNSMAVSKFHRTNMILWLVTFFHYTFLPSNPQHPKTPKTKTCRHNTLASLVQIQQKVCGEFCGRLVQTITRCL